MKEKKLQQEGQLKFAVPPSCLLHWDAYTMLHINNDNAGLDSSRDSGVPLCLYVLLWSYWMDGILRVAGSYTAAMQAAQLFYKFKGWF